MIKQPSKGSKYQMQKIVENNLTTIIDIKGNPLKIKKWLSPVKNEDYKEYCFCKQPFQTLLINQSEFKDIKIDWSQFIWPRLGKSPTLDGIAVLEDSTLLIVEAKSYPNESLSKSKAKKQIDIIRRCYKENKVDVKYIESKYYQLANRIALSNFLNYNGIKTKICYLCFCDDKTHTNERNITSEEKWWKSICLLKNKIFDLSSYINFCVIKSEK